MRDGCGFLLSASGRNGIHDSCRAREFLFSGAEDGGKCFRLRIATSLTASAEMKRELVDNPPFDDDTNAGGVVGRVARRRAGRCLKSVIALRDGGARGNTEETTFDHHTQPHYGLVKSLPCWYFRNPAPRP